jgi:hypothetical protein
MMMFLASQRRAVALMEEEVQTLRGDEVMAEVDGVDVVVFQIMREVATEDGAAMKMVMEVDSRVVRLKRVVSCSFLCNTV